MAMTVLHDAPDVAEKVFAAVALENRCPVPVGKHDVVEMAVWVDMGRFYAGQPRSGLRLVAEFTVG